MRSASVPYYRLKTSLIILLILIVSCLFIGMSFTGQSLPEDKAGISAGNDTLSTVYQYIGAEKCATKCHNNAKMGYQYDLWQKSSHSNAYKVLSSRKAGTYMRKAHLTGNPAEIQACLKCHITAAGLDTTYITSTYNKNEGVTCEACHKHYNNPKTYLPAESDCLSCHNNALHPLPVFSFKDKIRKIGHNRPVKS